MECLICACPLEDQIYTKEIRELRVGQGMSEPEACIMGSIWGWGGKEVMFVEKGFTLPELLTRHLSLAALVPGAKNTAEGKQDQTTIWRGQDRQGAGRQYVTG